MAAAEERKDEDGLVAMDPEVIVKCSEAELNEVAQNAKHQLVKKVKASNTKQVRKIFLGWLHFECNKNAYTCVRPRNGGGSRGVDMSLNATKSDVIEMGKSLFFENGCSMYGPAESMEIGIANYKQEDLTDVFLDGKKLPFTLKRYIAGTKMNCVCIYLTSKMPNTDPLEEMLENDFLEQNCIAANPHSSTPVLIGNDYFTAVNEIPSIAPDIDVQDTTVQVGAGSFPIASSNTLSEMADEQNSDEENCNLQARREARVPPASLEDVDSFLVQVRHISLGLIERRFRLHDHMVTVYDWVGSLSPVPAHFVLSDFMNTDFLPSQSVLDIASVLYMRKVDRSPAMDTTVNFFRFDSSRQD
eukprot:gene15466-biopygen12869